MGRLRNFFIRSRLRLLVKDNIILEFYETDYEFSKIRSDTCTSTCRSYFMFTLEKTSNNVNFREFLNKYLPVRWSRSRSKVTAPAPAKYPGRHRLRNPATKPPFFADLGQFCLTSPVMDPSLNIDLYKFDSRVRVSSSSQRNNLGWY